MAADFDIVNAALSWTPDLVSEVVFVKKRRAAAYLWEIIDTQYLYILNTQGTGENACPLRVFVRILLNAYLNSTLRFLDQAVSS